MILYYKGHWPDKKTLLLSQVEVNIILLYISNIIKKHLLEATIYHKQ